MSLPLSSQDSDNMKFIIQWPMLNVTSQKGFFKTYTTFYALPLSSLQKSLINIEVIPYWKINDDAFHNFDRAYCENFWDIAMNLEKNILEDINDKDNLIDIDDINIMHPKENHFDKSTRFL